jgi:hypothetical protein
VEERGVRIIQSEHVETLISSFALILYTTSTPIDTDHLLVETVKSLGS